ncbi:MAG: Abi family protein [Kiritimatiellaeota bacterium]|nr:Abi family protein [Kiritimatiellota bacterium]
MKPAKTIQELVSLLKARKMFFEDEREASGLLLNNNYYRMSGHWRKFQIDPGHGNDDFVDGTTFEKVATLYRLDASLRNILQGGIGAFEICFRSVFAYYASHSVVDGQFLYLCKDSYRDDFLSKNERPDDLLGSIRTELYRSKEKCVVHYKNKHEPIPMWAAVEVLSFGTLSKMYSRWMDKSVVKKVSQTFGAFKDYRHTAKIMRSMVNLRNLCAHQARLWNRELTAPVVNKDYFQQFGTSQERAQWRIISILMLLVDGITQCDDFSKRIVSLCHSMPDFYEGLVNPSL